MLAHQGMLEQLPLFPYFGPGDIVPTAALSLSLPELPRIHFYHYNDVPEVILTMAGDGALLATGQLYLQQGTHGVTTFLRKPDAAEAQSYQISFIIVRMRQEGPQMEGFILRCGKCNEVAFRVDRDVWTGKEQRYYPELPNLRFYADAADEYNAAPRTCPGCGDALPRFPTEIVGWRRYAQYADLANRARAALEAANR
jgi:ribosomal protein S27AE